MGHETLRASVATRDSPRIRPGPSRIILLRFRMRAYLASVLKPLGSDVPYYVFKSLDCSREMFCAIKRGVESKFDGFASIFYPTKCFLNAIKI